MSHFSEEQVAEFRDAFSAYDKDSDGVITANELINVLRSLGLSLTDGEVRDMIKAIGADENGMITFPEFLTIMTEKVRDSDSEEELKQVFKMADTDGNGTISAAELRRIMGTFGGAPSDKEVDEMIREADLDGDSQINYEEFVRIMLSK